MDNDDAIRINEQNKNLEDNELILKQGQTNQHSLNQEIIKRFYNITNLKRA